VLSLILAIVGAASFLVYGEILDVGVEELDYGLYAGVGFLVATFLAFMVFIGSGETALATQIGGEPLKVTVSRSMIREATNFSTAFFQQKDNTGKG